VTFLIDTEDLTRRFGDLVAVENLTLHISEGEVFGFLGPNGAGKTTTVRMLCCLISKTSARAMLSLYFRFFPFFLGVREGFEYLVVVECIGQMGGRVAQYGLALVLKQGSWVLLQESRTEHQPPKLGVVGSNPTPPATDEARSGHCSL
jgi:energy-coupling factor transporter ATP-binding protein EcfA2